MTFLEKNEKWIPCVDFHFTFPLASVPLQGTMLLAHKEVAQLLVGGKIQFQNYSHSHSQHEQIFERWAETERGGRMLKSD